METKTRDIKRIGRICGLLAEIWKKDHDWRFGQMLINYGLIKDDTSTWMREDDKLEKGLQKLLDKLKGGRAHEADEG